MTRIATFGAAEREHDVVFRGAFDTREAVRRILEATHDDIAGFPEGSPQNPVAGGAR